MSAALIVLPCLNGYLLTHSSPDYSFINGKEMHKGFPFIRRKSKKYPYHVSWLRIDPEFSRPEIPLTRE
jgi:hypothetical protein